MENHNRQVLLKSRPNGMPTTADFTIVVSAAILFDLGFPGREKWTAVAPYRELGRRAAAAAGKDFALGDAGAGLGARAGHLKGGIGGASLVLADGITVGALVAVQ